MPDILHRFTIEAPREQVHDLVATKEGVQRWWNAHPNAGDDTTLERGEFAAYPAGEMSRWS